MGKKDSKNPTIHFYEHFVRTAVLVITSDGICKAEHLLKVIDEGATSSIPIYEIPHCKLTKLSSIRVIKENMGLGVKHYKYT